MGWFGSGCGYNCELSNTRFNRHHILLIPNVSFLTIFEIFPAGLQTNARWWHVISVSGLKIDPRAFQSSDPIQRDICIRAVVPELLERSDMDLEQTIDYCRQFNIESEYATLCYVEKLLVQIPKGPISNNILSCNETKWARQIRKATLNIDEKTILKSLRIFLPKVHPLDYERIRFLSSWIVSALEEEEEMVSRRVRFRVKGKKGRQEGRREGVGYFIYYDTSQGHMLCFLLHSDHYLQTTLHALFVFHTSTHTHTHLHTHTQIHE